MLNKFSNVDYWYGPYDTLEKARLATAHMQKDGLTVAVASGSGSLLEYWWKDGDLVEKTGSLSSNYPKIIYNNTLYEQLTTEANSWVKVLTVTDTYQFEPAALWFLFNRGYNNGKHFDAPTLGYVYFGNAASAKSEAMKGALKVFSHPEYWKVTTTSLDNGNYTVEVYYHAGVVISSETGTGKNDVKLQMVVLANMDTGDINNIQGNAKRWTVPSKWEYVAEPDGDNATLFTETGAKYTAGTGISIDSSNKISSTVAYTAGTGIEISDNEISCTVTDTTYTHAAVLDGTSLVIGLNPNGDTTKAQNKSVNLSSLKYVPSGTTNQIAYYESTNKLNSTELIKIVKTDTPYVEMTNLEVTNKVYVVGSSVFVGDVTAGGFYETSDRRLKEDVEEVDIELDDIESIPVVDFKYKGKDKVHLGTIAQDVQTYFPELVSEGEDGMLSVDYSKLAVVAIAGIKKLRAQNEELRAELGSLWSMYELMADRIEKLEKK